MKKVKLLMMIAVLGLIPKAYADPTVPETAVYDDLEQAMKKNPNLQNMIKDATPESVYNITMNYATKGVVAPVMQDPSTGLTYAFTCKPHDCHDNQEIVIWDKDMNHVYVRSSVDGTVTLYGNPDANIQNDINEKEF